MQVSSLVTWFSAHFGLCHGYGENNSVIIQLQTLTVSHINTDVSESPSVGCHSSSHSFILVKEELKVWRHSCHLQVLQHSSFDGQILLLALSRQH